MKLIPVLLYFSAIVLCVSCGSSKKVTITPSTATTTRSLPDLPPSQINIPIKIYMKPLLALMDSMTAKEFTSDKWPNYTPSACDFRYKYRFLRSPFSLTCTNNRVTISFRGNYQIAGSRTICAFGKQVSPWVSGSCGFDNEPLRRVDININSVLTLLPNHQMLTTTHLDKLNAIDKCQVTLMNNDMTPQVLDSIKASVESYCTAFDNIVQALNNNELLKQWRSGGSRVMPISKYGFINLNPTMLRIGRFNVNRDTLYFSVGFTGTPQFSSDSLKLVTRATLPPINNTDNTGEVTAYINAIYDYKFFNKILYDSLHDKPFEVEGRTFVIKDVTVGGSSDGKIQVDVSFTGNRKGVLHLSGTPMLDTARQVLSMPDISFALDTRDMLVNIAKALFKKKVMKQLQNQSVMDLAALIQKNKASIESRINQQVTNWMRTTGSLQDIRLLGILPQKDYIQVQACIKANITLIGMPPSKLLAMSH